ATRDALGSRVWVRHRRARAQADPGRPVRPVRVRESGSQRGHAGRRTRRNAAAARRDPRRRFARVPFPQRVRARGELEDLVRELSRVLPLRRRAPWLQRRCRRLAGRLPARSEGARVQPVRTPPPERELVSRRRGGAAQPVPLPLAELRPERLSRTPEPVLRAHAPDRPRAHGAVSRLLLRAGRRAGLDRRAGGLRQPGRQGGPEPRGGRAARRPLGNPERGPPPLGERAARRSLPAALRRGSRRLASTRMATVTFDHVTKAYADGTV